jgi:hypothetical protein
MGGHCQGVRGGRSPGARGVPTARPGGGATTPDAARAARAGAGGDGRARRTTWICADAAWSCGLSGGEGWTRTYETHLSACLSSRRQAWRHARSLTRAGADWRTPGERDARASAGRQCACACEGGPAPPVEVGAALAACCMVVEPCRDCPQPPSPGVDSGCHSPEARVSARTHERASSRTSSSVHGIARSRPT